MAHNILDIFTEVVSLPVGARAARLAELSGGDAEVEATVRSMLRADEADSPLLDAPGAVEVALAVDLARSTSLVDEVVPTRIGPYAIRRILGSGGMGIVYLAEEPHPRRLVALKVLHADLRTPGYLDRFRLEVQTVADLRHPCIPQVLAAGEVDGSPWLAMELIDGVPIHHAAAGRDLHERIRLLLRVADTIQVVHERGVLHCDLKPANVLVAADATPYILDFGLASTTRRARERAGTPAYMAPEQRAGAELDARVDVFALGRLGREVLTFGRSASLPLDVLAVLSKADAPERADRYPSMAGLAADLRAILARRPVSARPATVAYRAERFFARYRAPLRAAAVGVGALALIVAGAALLTAHLARQAGLAREAAATLRLGVLEERLAALTDRPDEAADLVESFVRLPENQETAAISLAWMGWAELLDARGDAAAAADARGRAYVEATDPTLQRAALVAIARSFVAEARWPELDAVLGHLGPWDGQPEIEALRRQAASGGRRLGGLPAPVGRWARGTRLPHRAYRVDVAPWRPGSLVLAQQQPRNVLLELSAEPGFPVLREWPIPASVSHGFSFPRAVHGHDGAWVARTHDGALVLGGPTGPPRVVAEQPGVPIAATSTAAGDLLVGTGLPERALWRLRPSEPAGVARRPSPEVDRAASDVGTLVAHDLSGDGVDEVVIGHGPWNVYDVQVLRDRAGTLVGDARLQLGFVGSLALLSAADGPRIVAIKSDAYPNRIVLGHERPAGSPAGVYVLRWQPGTLSVEQFLPAPSPSAKLLDAVSGDIDGDGHADVIVGAEIDGRDVIWPLLGGPGGLRSLPLLGGLAMLGLVDVDGDGRAELVVRVPDDDHHTWVLGFGDRELPPADGPRFEPAWGAAAPSDAAVRRVWDRVRVLASMGLYLPAARALRHAEALNPIEDDRPLLALQVAEWSVAGGAASEARQALRGLDPDSVLDPVHRRRVARASLAVADLGAAERWLPDRAERRALAGELGWSGLPQAPEVHDLLSATAWAVHDPEGLVWSSGGMRLDLFADGAPTAEAALGWSGGALGLQVGLDLHDIEFGGEARFILSPEATPDLGLGIVVRHDGGGIDTQLTAGCDARPAGIQGRSWPLGRSSRVDRRLSVRLLWLDATERLICEVSLDGREVSRAEIAIDWRPPPGRWRLAIQGSVEDRPAAHARARLSVSQLVVEGASLLPDEPAIAAVAPLPITRQLRRHPALPQATPEALAAYARAWGAAVDSLDGADLARGMLLPALAALRGSTFDERLLLLGRAVVLAQQGEHEAAASALDTMLSASQQAGDERWFLVRRACALRITLARTLGDPQAEARVREAFARGHPDPVRASEQLDRLIAAIAPRGGLAR